MSGVFHVEFPNMAVEKRDRFSAVIGEDIRHDHHGPALRPAGNGPVREPVGGARGHGIQRRPAIENDVDRVVPRHLDQRSGRDVMDRELLANAGAIEGAIVFDHLPLGISGSAPRKVEVQAGGGGGLAGEGDVEGHRWAGSR